jgi:hypothetical protein
MSMKRLRGVLCVFTLTFGLNACTNGGAGPNGTASSENGAGGSTEMLVLDTPNGVEALDPVSGSVLFERNGVTAMPDWSKVFTAVPVGGSTQLREMDPRTGRTAWSAELSGNLIVRTVAQDGREVALMAPTPGTADPWTPADRTSTTIVVAHPGVPTGTEASTRYRLRGNFVPEAFSIDDRNLFMIEYLPAIDPVAYTVSSLSLQKGKVEPLPGRSKAYPSPERMTGTRLQQVAAPDGSQLYTLYTNQPPEYAKGYSHQADTGSRPVAFIHTLNLQSGWAYCLDLPRAFGPGDQSAKAFAVSPDGSRLYAIDTTAGLIGVVDTASLKVVRTERVPFALSGDAQTLAEVSADGHSLYVARGAALVAVDTATFATTARWSLPAPTTGLATSADGARLYASTPDDLRVLDPDTGHQVRSFSVHAVSGIDYIGTPVS